MGICTCMDRSVHSHGVSLCLIWQSDISRREVGTGFILFMLQLGLNIGWSALFFGSRAILPALLCILALWVVLLCTILQVSRFSVTGAALLIPYLLWTGFAAYLNYAILVLNL
jgi:translocator protein